MISTSITTTEPFTPPWLKDKTPLPVFHLRAGSVIERGQMEAELAGEHRAGRVFDFELRQAATEGVSALLADDPDLDQVLGLLAAEGEAEEDGAPKLSDADRRQLAQVREILAEHWAPYRSLVGRAERRREIAPIVALRRFCTGWDNCKSDTGKPVAFRRGPDGQVTSAALGELSQLEMMVAGNRAFSLQYGWGQEGNSERPSPSDDGQQTSGSGSTSTADGKSTGSAG